MNPFLYKAHPLLHRLISLLLDPTSATPADALALAALMLGLNLLWVPALLWAALKTDRLRLSLPLAYGLALPASLLYTPMLLTVVSDVAAHGFRFQERFLLVFALFVVSQTLAGLYAFALRHRPSGYPAGLMTGETIALFMLLYSLVMAAGLLGLDTVFGIFRGL
ncbi:hypothetical protein SAMN02949497_4675 [Methylomagnum ishizawai]|uniref:Yip1 domain-containing protein n=1 Tax=Methylomagnum ishizawai TaxID=1760988 RepID=A0A1Y6DAS3_9GAMM|nr:hypothetical protein [Methylomagnum ishizawai]SMF97254.1 hypothetical protein SAMN02949497_4675 [Methylomagnum ishizawai]